MKRVKIILFSTFLLASCSPKEESKKQDSSLIAKDKITKGIDDKNCPSNPDIGFRYNASTNSCDAVDYIFSACGSSAKDNGLYSSRAECENIKPFCHCVSTNGAISIDDNVPSTSDVKPCFDGLNDQQKAEQLKANVNGSCNAP